MKQYVRMDGGTQSRSSSDKFIKCASMRMDDFALLDSMNQYVT